MTLTTEYVLWTCLFAALIIAIIAVGARTNITKVSIDGNVDEAIEKLSNAVQQHVEVNAVLALTKKFQGDPELIGKLREYSDQTVAAVMLMRVNSLSNDIKTTQACLSKQRANKASSGHSAYDNHIKVLEQMLAGLMTELKEADKAIRQLGVNVVR